MQRYRAANCQRVGATKGHGKTDRPKESALPVKDICLYPLHEELKRLSC